MTGYVTRGVAVAALLVFSHVNCRPKRNGQGSYIHSEMGGKTLVDIHLGSSQHSHTEGSGSFSFSHGSASSFISSHQTSNNNHEWSSAFTFANSGAECADETFRAIPGTGCKHFQRCVSGKWYHEVNQCGLGTVWGNDVPGCVFPYNLDLTTCMKKSTVGPGASHNQHQHWMDSTTEYTTTAIRTTPPTKTSTTTTTTPTTTTSTTPTTTTTSTTPTSTTTLPTTTATALPKHFNTCKMLATLNDLGNHVPVENKNLKACASGSLATPEAFVIDHCNVASPDTWRQGANVLQQCQHIPLYTPVATFSGNTYSPSGSVAGIFLGCLSNGFQLGVQSCGSSPSIEHIVDGGIFTQDPQLYYTVQ